MGSQPATDKQVELGEIGGLAQLLCWLHATGAQERAAIKRLREAERMLMVRK